MSAMVSPIIVMSSQPTVARLLRIGEPLPADLTTGFTRIDPTWVWVTSGPSGIESSLIAAPGHGIAILLKISALPSASRNSIVKLLRRALTDISHRGYPAWMVCLDPDRPIEAKLLKIAIKAGGLKLGHGVIIGGRTNIGKL